MAYEVQILDELLNKTLTDIKQKGDEEIIFTVSDNEKYMMYHPQDCCEVVIIEDIVGDLNDLVGAPLVEAEVVSFNEKKELPEKEVMWLTLQGDNLSGSSESNTWTFYKFRTAKGSVSIRWHGSSNGYYGEYVNFIKLK